MNAAPDVAEWVETFTVLAVGSSLIVGLAAVAAAWFRSAAAQRSAWQAATLGVLALVLSELCGAGDGSVSAVGGWLSGATLSPAHRASRTPLPTPSVDEPAAMERAAVKPNEAQPEAIGRDAADTGAPPGPHAQLDALLGQLADLESELASAEDRAGQRQLAAAPTHSVAKVSANRRTWWPGALWLLGTLTLAAWSGLRRMVWHYRSGRSRLPDDGPLAERTRRVAAGLGYRRRIRLLEIPRLAGPVAFGAWRPTIGLPPSFGRDFAAAQQEAMLAHEVAHLAGRDPVWQSAAGAACALLWWQPLAWWQRRQLQAANETVADEASQVVADGPSVLADCLVRLGRRLARSRSVGSIGIEGSGFRSGLGRRVVRLLNLPRGGWRPERAARGAAVKTLAAAALLVVVLLTTAWARRPAPSGETSMSTFGMSWRKSLGAAALLAAWGPAGAAPAQEGQSEPATVVREDADRESQPPVEALLDRIKILEGELTAARHQADALREASQAERREAEAQQSAAERALRAAQQQRRLAIDLAQREDIVRERRAQEAATSDRGAAEAQRAVAVQRFRENAEEHIGNLEKQLAEAIVSGNKEAAAAIEEQLQAFRKKLKNLPTEGDAGPDAQVREKLEQARQEIEKLRAAGQVEEAEALERKVREHLASLERGEEKRPDPRQEEMARLKQQIGELRERGDREGAEKLERHLMELAEAGQPDKRREGDAGPDPQVREKLERARQEIEKLRAAGQVEEAEALERKVREHLAALERGEEKRPDPRHEEMARLKQELGELRERGEHEAAEKLERHLMELAEGGQPHKRHEERGEREELHRRLKHLTAAAENLRAGGMPDLAEQVHRQAEALHRELGGGGRRGDQPSGERRRPEGDRRPVPEGPGFRPEGEPRPERGGPPGGADRELIELIRGLRGEVQELRAQMNELRERVGHEEEEGEDDEGGDDEGEDDDDGDDGDDDGDDDVEVESDDAVEAESADDGESSDSEESPAEGSSSDELPDGSVSVPVP